MGQFTPGMVECMLTRLMRTPTALQETIGLLRPEHFRLPDEQHFALLWRAIQEAHQRQAPLTYSTLSDTIQMLASGLADFPEALLVELLAESGPEGRTGLVPYTFYGVKPEELDLTLTRRYVRAFLHERYVYAPLAASLAGGLSANLPTILAEASERYQRTLQIDRFPVTAPLGDRWEEDVIPRIPESTGIPFFDEFMDGGHAPGDTNGLLGPTGVGKTTIGVKLAVGVARVQRAQYSRLMEMHRTAPPPKTVYFVTYEQGRRDIEILLRAHAASVLTSRMAAVRNPVNDLSSMARGDFHPYEHAVHRCKYGRQADTVPMAGEYERLLESRDILRDGIQVIDLSGVEPERSRPGDGHVEEVASLIDLHQQRIGRPGVAVVIIDWVLLAVQRYLHANRMDESKHLRHQIFQYSDRSRLEIGGTFGTPVWLLQQLNNEGNKGDPTKLTSHTQAAEGSAFSQPLTWCACLGTKDLQSNAVLFNFSKTRRSAGLPTPKILQLRGEMANIEDASDRFMVDYARRRIRAIDDMRQIGEAPRASAGSQVDVIRQAATQVMAASPSVD